MIKKQYGAIKDIGIPTDEQMELINKQSLKALTKDEVFSFSVILCDNDIDRDFERFDLSALETLKKLFVGKTGILNHSMKSEDQSCRTYDTELVTSQDKKTIDGKEYVGLKAWCYTVHSDKNKDLIKDIEAGIKKEVSISCNSPTRICSICGKNGCNHIAGRKYENKLCYKTITQIDDAYEWSFVAVPAQRNAGVTKSKKTVKERNMENILKSIKEEKSLSLTEIEAQKLSKHIETLERKSADGERYRQSLIEKARKGFALTNPHITEKCVDDMLQSTSTDNLETLCLALEKQANKIVPPVSQLYREEKNTNNVANGQFKF